jgi:hypothetical protein
MLVALALGIVELLAPSWIALGFALGAGLVGLGLLTGLFPSLIAMMGGYGPGVLLVAFALLSLLSWFVLRQVFGPLAAETKTFEDDVND